MDKQKLNYLKGLLQHELENQQDRPLINMSIVQEEMDTPDNHPADAATDLEMVTTEKALEDHSKDEVEKIEAALKAMDDGTYGQCIECEKEIPYERLKAIPTALTCVDHVPENELN